ncbi:MAG: hypothetical protein OEU32_04240 [Acidimicrobiia bacterium]|nr:hypothetical protein [Acidimicrobiia bacterium]
MRRALWFGLGVGSSIWARRAARRRVQQYTPPEVVQRAKVRTTRAAREIRAAVGEGRDAMREFQEDARAEITADTKRRSIRAVEDRSSS